MAKVPDSNPIHSQNVFVVLCILHIQISENQLIRSQSWVTGTDCIVSNLTHHSYFVGVRPKHSQRLGVLYNPSMITHQRAPIFWLAKPTISLLFMLPPSVKKGSKHGGHFAFLPHFTVNKHLLCSCFLPSITQNLMIYLKCLYEPGEVIHLA